MQYYEAFLRGSTRLRLAVIFGAALAMGGPGLAAPAVSVCVLVPHFKDEYWLSVGYGLEQEARLRDATLWIQEAGGYQARESQIRQVDACVEAGVDAIVIGAVTSDHPDLLAAIVRAAEKVPVFALVNVLHSPVLSGSVGVDWADMGRAVGNYLAARDPAGGPLKTAVLISGPRESGWTAPLEAGLRDALVNSSTRIIAVYGADTGLDAQLALVETALSRHPDVDYIIGSAPTIEAAMGHLRAHPDANRTPRLIATYLAHTVKRGLVGGSVLFAPFDDPQEQGRMALRQVLTFLQDHRRVGKRGPKILPLTPGDSALQNVHLSPADYFPKIE